ncbi:multicopy suppressor of BFA (Brefeldin A) [Rhodotorula kratochvilovae]
MAAARTIPGASAPAPLTKAQRKAAAQASQGPALKKAGAGADPAATVVEVKPKEESTGGRPDKAAYDAEQDALRAEIDALQAKSNDLRNKISASSNKGGPDHERKLAVRKELDALRGEQARLKGGRGKTLDQLRTLQDAMNKKIKDLQAAKAKAPFKTVQEVENQIKSLERQVESGTMKLVDEKKALNEISALRKSRKLVESFATQQSAIDADKAKIDEVRKELDDPEQKAANVKFDGLRKELDEINKRMDEVSKGRDGLFEERNAISKQLDELFSRKKASATAFREANNKYYQKLNEDRAKRDERRRAERKAHEDSKRAEINERLLEEAQAPAFEREIDDCRTLIRFFQQRIGLAPLDGPGANGASLFARPEVAGVPKLEIRKVENELPKGAVALKKKGEQEEEAWGGFAGKKGKKGGNKKAAPAPTSAAATENGDAAPAPAADEKLNLPLGTLTALMSLGIAAPLTTGEVQKAIDSLQLKMRYFNDNQDRVTKERVAAVQKKIAAADKASQSNESVTVDAAASAEPTDKEEEVKDAQPQPIEDGASKEAEEATADAEATEDAAEEKEEEQKADDA